MPKRLAVLPAVVAALSTGQARADVLTVAQVLPLEGSVELSTAQSQTPQTSICVR